MKSPPEPLQWDGASFLEGKRSMSRLLPIGVALLCVEEIVRAGAATIQRGANWAQPWEWVVILTFAGALLYGCWLMAYDPATQTQTQMSKVIVTNQGINLVARRSARLFGKYETVTVDAPWSGIDEICVSTSPFLDSDIDTVVIRFNGSTDLGKFASIIFKSKTEAETWASAANEIGSSARLNQIGAL